MSYGQLFEYHALHTQIHAQRRLEEIMIASCPHLKEGEQRKVQRIFQQHARRAEDGGRNAEQTESEMPLSAADFERMRKEQDG